MHTGLTPAVSKLQLDHFEPQPDALVPHNFSQLPADAKDIDRYYFYGWHVTMESLTDISARYKCLPMFDVRGPADGFRFLCSIYKDLHLLNALVEPDDTYENVYPGYDGDLNTMVVVIYTNIRELQHQRATQPQLLQLNKVFGKEPRWFKDGWRMDHFEDYEIL